MSRSLLLAVRGALPHCRANDLPGVGRGGETGGLGGGANRCQLSSLQEDGQLATLRKKGRPAHPLFRHIIPMAFMMYKVNRRHTGGGHAERAECPNRTPRRSRRL